MNDFATTITSSKAAKKNEENKHKETSCRANIRCVCVCVCALCHMFELPFGSGTCIVCVTNCEKFSTNIRHDKS